MTIDQTLVTIIVAAIAAVPPTLLALAGWRQGQRNNVQGVAVLAQAESVGSAVLVGVKKVDEIHEQTNGTLSALRAELVAAHADLVVARAEISGLRLAMLKHGVGDRRQRPRTRGTRR